MKGSQLNEILKYASRAIEDTIKTNQPHRRLHHNKCGPDPQTHSFEIIKEIHKSEMDFVGLAARIWVPAQGRIFFQNHVLGWSGGWFLRPIMQQLGLCFAKLWKHMCGRTVFPFLAFRRQGFSISSVGELPLVFIVEKASEDFIFPLFFEREKSFAPQLGGQ